MTMRYCDIRELEYHVHHCLRNIDLDNEKHIYLTREFVDKYDNGLPVLYITPKSDDPGFLDPRCMFVLPSKEEREFFSHYRAEREEHRVRAYKIVTKYTQGRPYEDWGY